MKLTKIAVALVAVLAMSAVVASSASALEYKSTVNPVMLFGEDTGNHQFTVDGQAVTCTTAIFEKASQAVPTKRITGITASYNGCTAFGFAATVNMGSCTYTFEEPNRMNPNNEPNVFTAKVDLVCPNNPATVNTNPVGSECSVSLTGNENTINNDMAHLKIETNNPKMLVTATVNGINVTKNKDNLFCPLSGTGNVNNGTYNGPTPVEGTGGAVLSIG